MSSRPASPGHTFGTLITRNGTSNWRAVFFVKMSPSLQTCMRPTPKRAGPCHCTWLVPSEGCQLPDQLSWITPQRRLERLHPILASVYCLVRDQLAQPAQVGSHSENNNGKRIFVCYYCEPTFGYNFCTCSGSRVGVHTSARAHLHAPFPYREKGWLDCVEICIFLGKKRENERGGTALNRIWSRIAWSSAVKVVTQILKLTWSEVSVSE